MSEPTLASGAAADVSGGGEETTGQAFGGEQTQESGNGFNPAWNPLLEKLPSEFHNMIAPDLKSWDQKFQEQLQQVQSRYAPYQEFVDNEIPAEDLQAALQLAAVLQADPRGFYDRLGEHYRDEWGQGQQGNDPSEDTFELGSDDPQEFDITQHPKFQELSQQNQLIAQFLANQIQEKEQAEADAALEAEEKTLLEKYGDFNPEWVYPYAMQTGKSLEEAVQAYHQMIGQIRQTPTANDSAPSVFRPSGAIPSSQPNPADMSSKDTKHLVAQILAQANQG